MTALFNARVATLCHSLRAQHAWPAQIVLADFAPQAGPLAACRPMAAPLRFDDVLSPPLRPPTFARRARARECALFDEYEAAEPGGDAWDVCCALAAVRRCAFSRKSRKVGRGALVHVRWLHARDTRPSPIPWHARGREIWLLCEPHDARWPPGTRRRIAENHDSVGSQCARVGYKKSRGSRFLRLFPTSMHHKPKPERP